MDDFAKNVLVVEDEEGIREILRMILEIEGYQVTTAVNGQDALDKLNDKKSFNLILLDLMMPIMNGLEFMDRLNHVARYKEIPVILLTAYSDFPRPDRANHLLWKPVDFNQMLSLIQLSIQEQQ